ncbi:PREDICTED: transmembrane protein 5-like [Priapulus caudatus]|uniref:Transmembrane protein 5-like n=1 Tax=Priapulus caudatus TaxID=37621 RepID=A0ABM1ET46_PRICU|nr:PREDICTED: transmembrane protein 5-like [Priapulus caudatus]
MLVRRLSLVIFLVYIILTCYFAYLLIYKNLKKPANDYTKFWEIEDPADEGWNPWGQEFEREEDRKVIKLATKPRLNWAANRSLDQYEKKKANLNAPGEYRVEIWGKAAIGLYLWEHIFQGKLESKMEGTWSSGFRKVGNIKFVFRTGPGVIPSKVPPNTEHVVLILNTRDEGKVEFARIWLDFLPKLRRLRLAIVILLGDERCRNDWLLPYMAMRGGLINYTYVVYDSPLVDDKNFFQWPLGVATWLPDETEQSRVAYISALSQSDLTLSPVGLNSESYRIYEAMSYGSVPVLEDVMTAGSCGAHPNASVAAAAPPYRLLKEMRAPVMFVRDWTELPAILDRERALSLEQVIERRKRLVEWYEHSKLKLREHFLTTLQRALVASPTKR